MDAIIEIIARWDHFGQGLFFLMLVSSFLVLCTRLAWYGTVCLRGWPPPSIYTPLQIDESEDEDEEDDEEE